MNFVFSHLLSYLTRHVTLVANHKVALDQFQMQFAGKQFQRHFSVNQYPHRLQHQCLLKDITGCAWMSWKQKCSLSYDSYAMIHIAHVVYAA